jgi:hypothetical protein
MGHAPKVEAPGDHEQGVGHREVEQGPQDVHDG